jgi:hypothetical protein
LIVSPLSQRVTRDGTAVEVEIYGDGNGAWLLEVVDEFGNSTVWDDSFPTDRAALAEALNVIDGEGIAAVIGSPPASARAIDCGYAGPWDTLEISQDIARCADKESPSSDGG